VPLYLGRVASFLTEQAGRPAAVVAEWLGALCQEYERAFRHFMESWTPAELR
jgi:hypothetical protein